MVEIVYNQNQAKRCDDTLIYSANDEECTLFSCNYMEKLNVY